MDLCTTITITFTDDKRANEEAVAERYQREHVQAKESPPKKEEVPPSTDDVRQPVGITSYVPLPPMPQYDMSQVRHPPDTLFRSNNLLQVNGTYHSDREQSSHTYIPVAQDNTSQDNTQRSGTSDELFKSPNAYSSNSAISTLPPAARGAGGGYNNNMLQQRQMQGSFLEQSQYSLQSADQAATPSPTATNMGPLTYSQVFTPSSQTPK
jgi:hypothetical protein